tara:strand:- start:1884 stop:2402 length:519 start_codon:yes stop_codon:yes gene_type:complete
MRIKLEQQPVSYIEPGAGGGVCVTRSIINEKQRGLDVQWGSLLMWDRGLNAFDFSYGFHVWNTNEAQDTIYDDLDALYQDSTGGLKDVGQEPFIINHPSQWKEIRMVDGSKIKCEGNCRKKRIQLSAYYTKHFKGVDAIYLTEFAVDNQQREYQDWDTMEELFTTVEHEYFL